MHSIKVLAMYKTADGYKNLFESNSIVIPNNQIIYPTSEIYMRKLEGFQEIINASLNDTTLGLSSKEYAQKSSKIMELSFTQNQHLNSKILGEN